MRPPSFPLFAMQVLQELESYDAAREAAGKAVQLQPDWPDAHATYARCCLNCGAVKEALQAFNTARVCDHNVHSYD